MGRGVYGQVQATEGDEWWVIADFCLSKQWGIGFCYLRIKPETGSPLPQPFQAPVRIFRVLVELL
jgi:hypothetical protein